MSGTGDFFPALAGMVQAVFGERDIDAKHREVIILRAGDRDLADLDNDYRLLIAATDELLQSGTLTDGTLQGLLDAFGTTITRKYIATIAWFSLLSLFLNGTRVPLETTDKIGTRTSPLG
ncbi:hypothetical protein [Mycolicibacterium celeriflavum]|uniref:hypothetical protein n=1 Tax=Mycolicibacterium celeriflavum TaxID=1249101 RepID=UPI003CEF1E8A